MERAYIRAITKTDFSDGTIDSFIEDIKLKHENTRFYIENNRWEGASQDVINELIKDLEEKDTVIIDGFERLSNDFVTVFEYLNRIVSKGATVHIRNSNLIINRSNIKFIYSIINQAQKSEKLMRRENKAIAIQTSMKNTDKQKGRDNLLNENDSKEILELLKTKTRQEVATLYGVSVSTLARYIRKVKEERYDL